MLVGSLQFPCFNNTDVILLNPVCKKESGHADDIEANLIVWDSKVELPFGAPGDPSSDYTTGGIFGAVKGCGVKEKSTAQPYKGTYHSATSCST